jgi:hypothetical protein
LGLQRHLGHAGHLQLQDALRRVVKRSVLNVRSLLQRVSASLYLWDASGWHTQHQHLDREAFRKIFQSKVNAGHCGKGLAATVSSGKPGKSNNVLQQMKDAAVKVNAIWAAAIAPVRQQFAGGGGVDDLRDFVADFPVKVRSGGVTDEAAARFGATCRTHFKKSWPSALKNMLHFATELDLGDAIDTIPYNVSESTFFLFLS